MLDKITIVIPTHNRHSFLQRVLDYYRGIETNIIISDSSRIPFSNCDQFENIQYFYYPKEDFNIKMSKVFQYIKTPYVALCADDDFIVPFSIEKCLIFLESNPDYVSVQGENVAFSNEEDIKVNPLYTNTRGYNIDGETARERLEQSMHPYMHQFYSVHRVESIKNFFQKINSQITNQSLGEIAMVLTGVINGKHKVLPIFYSARDSFTDPKRLPTPSVLDIMVKQELKKDYEMFLFLIADHFSQKTTCDPNEAKKLIRQVMEYYKKECLKKYYFINSIRREFYSLRSKIYKKLKLFFPKCLTNYRRRFYQKKFVGHSFYEIETIKEWNKIKSFIISHNVVSSKIL